MRILLADDDMTSRLIAEATVRKLGHIVTAVEDGQQALDAAARETFNVLVTDWMMPRVDGLDLCRAIRAGHRNDYTYIILLTVLGGRQNYLDAIEAGADDFMTKPLDEDVLAARLNVAERILRLHRHVNNLEGLLPICAYCKKIRVADDRWQQIESYITERSETRFSHGACPECYEKAMSEIDPRR